MIILIHTSKTMRPLADAAVYELDTPVLIKQATEVATYVKTLSVDEIQSTMKLSPALAVKTHQLVQSWTTHHSKQRAAIDSFLGDIYSGLQIQNWSNQDRAYAQKHLRILSGLYGILRPLDGIHPYRLELGYRLPAAPYKDLYAFWGTAIADTLPQNEPIIDLSAVEYGKTVTNYVDASRVSTPRFLTVSPKTGEPTFVVVHAKIARGAFASWLIRNKIDDPQQLHKFNEIGYVFNAPLSTPQSPVFICETFGGIGLSVRLS